MPIEAKKGKKGRKIGRQARSPAQARYWSLKKLRNHKVRNILRNSARGKQRPTAPVMTWEKAVRLWERARMGRRRTLAAGMWER